MGSSMAWAPSLVLALAMPKAGRVDAAVTYFPNSSNINSIESRNVATFGIDSEWVKILGRTDSLRDCGDLCEKWTNSSYPATKCRTFTRYSATWQNTSLAGLCLGHVDYTWVPIAFRGVDSGKVE